MISMRCDKNTIKNYGRLARSQPFHLHLFTSTFSPPFHLLHPYLAVTKLRSPTNSFYSSLEALYLRKLHLMQTVDV